MNDMRSSEDNVFVAEARRALDESSRQIDARLAGRLQRVRREAMGMSDRRSSWAAGVAVASVCVLTIAFFLARPDLDYHAQPVLEDLDLVISTENVELSEDLEFYDWLADSTSPG
jgi:hypothetical protein